MLKWSSFFLIFYLCIDMLTNLKYIISIAIILISIPISDNITKKITNLLQEKNLNKYKNFISNTLFILFIRVIIVAISIVIAGMISNINMNYIFGGIGIISLMLPITLQSPAQDFVCGILMISMDKIRPNELVRIKELNLEGKIVNISGFSTSILDPLTQGISEIPNHKLWTMTIQSISRSPKQKILLEIMISNRNDMGVLETVIRKILMTHSNVIDVNVAYVKQNDRGLTLNIPISVDSNKSDFLLMQTILYKHLKIGLQKYGIVFVDGATPVDIKNKSDVVTPIIVNSITPV